MIYDVVELCFVVNMTVMPFSMFGFRIFRGFCSNLLTQLSSPPALSTVQTLVLFSVFIV